MWCQEHYESLQFFAAFFRSKSEKFKKICCYSVSGLQVIQEMFLNSLAKDARPEKPKRSGSTGLSEEISEAIVPAKLDLSLTQRMISASLGSIVTAFVLTPFDVIRIRMQQQEILPDEKPCCADHVKDIKMSKRNTLVNTTAELSKSEAHLFWLDKDYCKNMKNCSRIDSTFQGFVTIGRNEGLATLWRGMSLTLLMAVPLNVIYFTGYEYIRDNSPILGAINSLFCGSLARLLAATSVAPIELIKTRLQSIPSSRNNPKILESVLKDSWEQVKTRGLRSLFTGLQITLWRDVPFSGIYWSLYETCKLNFTRLLNVDFQGNTTEDHQKVFATSFLSGSLSGLVAAVLTHPFDVGKTRMQISQSGGNKRPQMFKFLYGIYKNEGPKSLFGGLGPRIIKIAPACAIMISSYEMGKKLFLRNNNETVHS